MASGLFTLKQQVQALRQGAWNGQKPPSVEYLVVAGGGGGGGTNGGNAGGGGAGGLLQGISSVSTGSAITVTVGAGGNVGGSGATGSTGGNSVFGNITTIGGGGGGAYAGTTPGSGGSGGGSAQNGRFGGAGIVGQGNSGGGFGFSSDPLGGAGGGGAGTIGLQQPGVAAGFWPQGGNGGVGVASAISGTVTAYAGGGGGSAHSNGSAIAVGGAGGGGNGHYSTTAGTSGTSNTGGGGGGAGETVAGGSGGSGIVIISYPDLYAAPVSTTGSPTVSTSGSGSIYLNGSTYADYPASTSNRAAADFTLETWVNLSSFNGGGYTTLFSMDPNACYWSIKSSTNVAINLAGTELTWTTSTISINTWYHMAAVRIGTTITLYINGVSQGTVTSSAVLGGANPGAIRIGSASGYALTGYMSNFRYTKSAVYTSSFTPSIIPLTSLTDTRLLLNAISPSPFNDSSSIAQVPTVTGTSSWNASSPFAMTGYKNRVYTWTSSGSITF